MIQQQTHTSPYAYNLLQIFSKALSNDIGVLYLFPPGCSLAVK